MADNLKILITGQLNTGATIGEINTALRGIEKKINALKLNVEINDKVLSTLNKFSDQMKKISTAALNTGKVIEEAINPDGSKIRRTYFDGIKGEFSEIAIAAKKSAQEQMKSLDELDGEYDKVTKNVERYNAAQKKVGSSVSLSDNNGINTRTVNLNDKDKVIGYTDSYNAEKEAKLEQQAIKQEQDLIDQMEKFRLQSIQRRMQAERSADEAQQKAIQRNAELDRQEIAKTQQARQQYENWWLNALATQEQQQRKQQQATVASLDVYKRQAEIQATGLLNNKNKVLTPEQTAGINSYLNSVRALNASTPQLAERMKQLGLDFKEISVNAQQASYRSISFGEAFKTAISKFSIWMGASTLFFQSLRFITNGVSYINQLNSALTEISIVTGKNQEQVNALGDSYNKLAQQMGVTTTEIAQTSASLFRQGLSQDEVTKRMKTIIEYAKISSLDINTASEIMTAAMNSMGVSATRAADVWSYLGDATATGKLVPLITVM